MAENRKKIPTETEERNQIREWFLNDLWFMVYFGFAVAPANHPFVVQACRDVEDTREKSSNLCLLWAREHFKSTIVTCAESLQVVLRERVYNKREVSCGIFSHTRPAAKAFLRTIKLTLEQSVALRFAFPDILYEDPAKEAPKWSEDDGLILKRRSAPKESTFEAWGLIEGMPTGKHFFRRVYDDIETDDLVYSPEMTQKVKDRYDMSVNLGVDDGHSRVVGTFYHHEGPLMHVINKSYPDGEKIFLTTKKPATEDGTPTGKPVLLSQKKLLELQANESHFYSQQLLDPTPRGRQKIDWSLAKVVTREQLPQRLYKFLTIDSAGVRESDNRQGDSWAILVHGVEPYRDDLGLSNVFLLDGVIAPMDYVVALDEVYKLYMRNGFIRCVGVEKVGAMTAEIHIANKFRAKGKLLSEDTGTLKILRPGGRSKWDRIEAALPHALRNGKYHILNTCPGEVQERLRIEAEKYPFWKDDGLDAASYLWDVIKEFRFGLKPVNEGVTDDDDFWDNYGGSSLSWMVN